MSAARTRSRPLLVAALMGVVLMLVSPLLRTTPAAASDVTLDLVDVTDWNGPTSTFRVEVRVADLPADARLTFSLHDAVSGREALDQALAGRGLGGTLLSGDLQRTADTATVAIPITPRWPAPENGVVLSDSGVHPVVIRALSGGGTELGRLVTTLIRLPTTTTTSPLGVAFVADIAQPQTTALDGSTYLAAAGQQNLRDIITALSTEPTVPLTIRPSAMTLEQYAVADDNWRPVLTQLRSSSTRQLIGAPWAPIALSSWLADGLETEAREQLTVGPATVGRLTATSPETRIAVLDRSIDTRSLPILRATGADSLVVPSDQVPSLSTAGSAALTQQFSVRGEDGTVFRAVAGDQRVSARLVSGGDPIAAAHDALAELASLRLESQASARGLAVVVPAGVSPRTLTRLLRGLGDRDGSASGSAGTALVSPVTVDDLFTITDAATSTNNAGVAATTIRSITGDEPVPLGAYPAELRAAQAEIAGLLSLVPETPTLTGPARDRALASGDRSLDADRRGAAITSVHGAITAVTGEIVMSPQQIVTLTSHSGRVPLNIENRLQVPAHVHVRLTSAKLDFPEGAEFDLVLEPATTTRVDAQVTTRASGAFPLDVSIRSADDSLAVTGARFTVRSTAISGVGLVISIGAGLFLLLWWVRHFRTTRRAARLVGDAEPPSDGTTTASPAPATDATDAAE